MKQRKINLEKAKNLCYIGFTMSPERKYLRFKILAYKYAKKNNITYEQAFRCLTIKRVKRINKHFCPVGLTL